MECKFEPIFDKLEKAGRTEEADIVRQYAEAKKTEKMQGLLDPEQQDLIQQVTELNTLSNVVMKLMSKPVAVNGSIVAEINGMKPKWKNRAVTVVSIVQDAKGNATALVKLGNKHYTTDVALLQTEQGSIKDKIEYGTDGEKSTADAFVKRLDTSRAVSVNETLELFDELVNKDTASISDGHKKYLRDTLKYVVGSLSRALPEMSVYVSSDATVNKGHFVLKPQGESEVQLELNLTGSNSSMEKSIAEAYVHEMVHAATAYALERMKENMPFEIIRLRKIREAALKAMDYTAFLPEVSVNKQIEETVAKATYDYINKSMPEFIAYAMTNEKVRNVLKDVMVYESKKPEKLLAKLVYYAKKLVDMALMKWRNEDITTSGNKAIDNLFIKIATVQAEAMTEAKKKGMSLDGAFDAMDDFVAGKMDKLAQKLERKVMITPKPVGSAWKKARWFAEGFYQLLTNGKTSGVLETVLSSLKMKPEGTVQNIISHIKEGDSLQNIATELGLQSLQIDGHRETVAVTIANVANNLFKKTLKVTQRKALQVGLQMNDAAQLIADGRIEEIKDDVAAQKRYDELKNELGAVSSPEEMRFYMHQIEGLAKYMLTGKGSSIQLKNAIAIARRLGTNISQPTAKVSIVKMIDEMISLKAWEMTDESAKNEIRNLLEVDRKAVEGYVKLHKGMQEYVKKGYTVGQKLNMPKNYHRETYDNRYSNMMAPLSEKAVMERKGYKLLREVPTVGGSKATMGLYISKDMVKQPFNKSALRIIGTDQDGIPLMQMEYYARNIDAYKTAKDARTHQKKVDAISVELVMRGKTPALEEAIMPVFNDKGEVVDYVYTTAVEDKMKHMGLELDGTESIGRGFAHEVDKEESLKHNQVLWEEMMLDLARNKGFSNINKNLKEYVEINVASDIGVVADIARILPKEYKDALYTLKKNTNALDDLVALDVVESVVGERVWKELNDAEKENLRVQLSGGKLWLRRDMLLPMFGARDLSIMNNKYTKFIPQAIQTFIRHLEGLWKSFVSLYKIDVVVKTIPVFVGNFISNFMSGLMAGENPIDIVKNYIAAWTELNHYIDTKQKIARLHADIALGKDADAVQVELARLVSDLESSSLKPLVDAGLYTQIVEETEAVNYTSSNRIARWAQMRQEVLPDLVRKGMDVLWVTEKTAMFQVLHAAQAKSDFVARYSQFVYAKKKEVRKLEKSLGRKLTESEINKIEHKTIKFVRTAFVNYTSPDSPLLQYLNDMGFVLFTKYAIRIQAAIHQLFAKYPVRAAAALFGQELMFGAIGWEPDDVTEKALFTHGTDIFYSPDILDMFKNVFVPQTFEYANDLRKIVTS